MSDMRQLVVMSRFIQAPVPRADVRKISGQEGRFTPASIPHFNVQKISGGSGVGI